MAVYRNNVAEIVKGALGNVYPTIQALVGDTCFRSLASHYSRFNKSVCGDLQAYGAVFPAMLDQIYASSEHGFLGDVARLEFALDACLCAESVPGITGEQLHSALSIDSAEARLKRNPSLFLIESRYPILDIWRAHRDGETDQLSIDEPAQNVAVVRAGNDARMTVVSRAGARMIRALEPETAIDDLCVAIEDADTDELTVALRDVVASRAIVEVVI
jgi:hypothetical protein